MRKWVLFALLALVMFVTPLMGACTTTPSTPAPQPTAAAPAPQATTPAAAPTTAPAAPAASPQAAAPAKTGKDTIRIGWACAFSGSLASTTTSTNGPVYELWIDQVNKAGGIYVKEYDKKLPIELIKYDDKSDVGTMTKLVEKLILEDKVDFILPPVSTAFLYASAPIADKYQYILIGGPGGALKLKELKLPYFFQTLNFADTQMPVMADLLAEAGVKTAAILSIQDLHGVEYREVMAAELQKRGIQVVIDKTFPIGVKDLSPEIKEAQAANVDAFLCFSYPDETMLVTGQAIELGYNPKVFEINVGGSFAFFRDAFKDAVEGIMTPGGYNEKSSPGIKKFIEDYKAFTKSEPDYWGQAFYYSSLQAFQQAIEKAGTLDQAKIRDIMANDTFDTAIGPWKYVDNVNVTHPGEVGQWQKGVFEVIGPKDKATAPMIYPKPEWPKQQ